MVKTHFKEDFNAVFKHLSPKGGNVVEDDMRSLMFGDYLGADGVSTCTTVHCIHTCTCTLYTVVRVLRLIYM